MDLPSVLGKRSQPEPSPVATMGPLKLEQSLEEAIAQIDSLSAAAQITADAVEELQQNTLNPLIDDLLDRPENDLRRQRINQKLTALNQRLRRGDLPTVRLDRLSTLPPEVFSTIVFYLRRRLPALSRGIMRVQQDAIEFMTTAEENMKVVLGERFFEEVRGVSDRFPHAQTDVILRVSIMYASLWRNARMLSGWGYPPFTEQHLQYSYADIAQLGEYVLDNLEQEVKKGSRALALGTPQLDVIMKAERVRALSFEEQVRYAEALLEHNKLFIAQVTDLDLANFDLRKLCFGIEDYSSLEVLNLNSNKLVDIPPYIAKVRSLEELWVADNCVLEISPGITSLRKLKILDLTNNRMQWVPTKVWDILSLEELYLGENKLSLIFPLIAELRNLKILHLNKNQIAQFSISLWQLPALEELNLADNALTNIPREIGSVTTLRKINFSGNKIETIPPEVGKLTSLTRLRLNKNEIGEIPSEIGQLVALKKLDVSDNKLTRVPREVSQLPSLRSLNLQRNRIATFPPEIVERFPNALNEQTLASETEE